MFGAVTVTLKLHEAVFPAASVAVQLTEVVPTGKLEPEAGMQLVVTPGRLSEATGAEYVITLEVCPAAAAVAILAGQVIVGATVSKQVNLTTLPCSFPNGALTGAPGGRTDRFLLVWPSGLVTKIRNIFPMFCSPPRLNRASSSLLLNTLMFVALMILPGFPSSTANT